MKKEGGHNIMKEQAFQKVVKSTFLLVNGGKIIKWWVVIGGECWKVMKRYLALLLK
jgi:hypothetical protein